MIDSYLWLATRFPTEFSEVEEAKEQARAAQVLIEAGISALAVDPDAIRDAYFLPPISSAHTSSIVTSDLMFAPIFWEKVPEQGGRKTYRILRIPISIEMAAFSIENSTKTAAISMEIRYAGSPPRLDFD